MTVLETDHQKLGITKGLVVSDFSRDGKRLAALSGRNELWLWATDTGELVAKKVLAEDSEDLAFFSSGDRLAVISAESELTILDIPTLRIVAKQDVGHKIRHLRFTSDGRLVATGRGVYETEHLSSALIWSDAADGFLPMGFYLDGVGVIGAGPEGAVVVRETKTGRVLLKYDAQTSFVCDCQCSPSGRFVAAITEGGRLRFWTSVQEDPSTIDYGEMVESFAFSPHDRRLIWATERRVAIWDTENQETLTYLRNKKPVKGDAYRFCGDRLMTIEQRGQGCVCALRSGTKLTEVSPHANGSATASHLLQFSPCGEKGLFLRNDEIPVLLIRQRPEQWWGIAWLWEFWLTAFFGIALIWSLWRDRKLFKAKAAEKASAVADAHPPDAPAP
jgi:WD40 repeat protein